MFWSPPTSPLSSSGTAETVTAPSWEASAPTPSPASSIGTVTTSGPAPSSMAAASDTIPASRAARPHVTTRRGTGLRPQLRYADGRGQQGDRERQQPDAGLHGAEAERHRQEQRHGEEQPGLEQELEEEHGQPAGQLRVVEHRRRRPGARARPAALAPPTAKNSRTTTSPARTSHTVIERPARSGASGFGLHPAPLAGPEHAVHREAEAGGGQHHADQVEPDAARGGGVLDLPGQAPGSRRRSRPRRRTPAARSSTSCTAPPISGPAATAIAPAEATSP